MARSCPSLQSSGVGRRCAPIPRPPGTSPVGSPSTQSTGPPPAFPETLTCFPPCYREGRGWVMSIFKVWGRVSGKRYQGASGRHPHPTPLRCSERAGTGAMTPVLSQIRPLAFRYPGKRARKRIMPSGRESTGEESALAYLEQVWSRNDMVGWSVFSGFNDPESRPGARDPETSGRSEESPAGDGL